MGASRIHSTVCASRIHSTVCASRIHSTVCASVVQCVLAGYIHVVQCVLEGYIHVVQCMVVFHICMWLNKFKHCIPTCIKSLFDKTKYILDQSI